MNTKNQMNIWMLKVKKMKKQMLEVKRMEGKVDQIKIMESKMFHYACVCIHASLTFVYHDNRDLSLCCSASEYGEIGPNLHFLLLSKT